MPNLFLGKVLRSSLGISQPFATPLHPLPSRQTALPWIIPSPACAYHERLLTFVVGTDLHHVDGTPVCSQIQTQNRKAPLSAGHASVASSPQSSSRQWPHTRTRDGSKWSRRSHRHRTGKQAIASKRSKPRTQYFVITPEFRCQ